MTMRLGLWRSVLLTLLGACGADDAPSLLDDDSIVYPVPDWQTVSANSLGFDQQKLDQVATLAEANDSHCLVVTRKGRIVGEWYWDGWTAQSEQAVHSVTKSITSTLVGIAQDRGLLNLADKAALYIPEWQAGESAEVRVKNLVSNDSGRQWTFLKDYIEMAGTAEDKSKYAVDLGQDHPPGTYWEYNNSAIQTLERVLKRATGEADVAAFARSALFEPLGVKSSMGHDTAGNTLMFGELQASCRDLARFGYLFLRGGKWSGDRSIVSSTWVKDATSTSTPLNAAYGYLWWLNNDGHYVRPSSPTRVEGEGKQMERLPNSTFAALGLGGQMVAVDPEHEIVMTRIGGAADTLSAFTSGSDPVGSSVVAELGNALADAVKE